MRIIPTGIETKLYCGDWLNIDEVYNEITLTIDNCKGDIDYYFYDWGWTGYVIWFTHAWIIDYLSRT